MTGATRRTFRAVTPALIGTTYGVDFNPVGDALRIVSDTEQNLRVPFTGDTRRGAERHAAAVRRGRPRRRVEPGRGRRGLHEQLPRRDRDDAVRHRHRA